MEIKGKLFIVGVILFRLHKWIKRVIIRKKDTITKKELIDYYAMYHLS
jgi:hypothetical protein